MSTSNETPGAEEQCSPTAATTPLSFHVHPPAEYSQKQLGQDSRPGTARAIAVTATTSRFGRQDVCGGYSRKLGRKGLDYWSITVLAAVRLGCNLDYDKLQNLAEEHRTLRMMMGIGDWEEKVDFDWRRIRDNLCLLRPETVVKINQLMTAASIDRLVHHSVILELNVPSYRA